MKIKPTRRLFLKGVGGYMLSLPILEVMLNGNGNAYANGENIQGSYIYTYQGESSGHPRNNTLLWKPPSLGNLANAYNQDKNHYGNSGVKPIAERGLLDDVNVISNLYINSNNKGAPGNIHVKGNSSSQAPIVHRSAQFCVNSGFSSEGSVYSDFRNPKGQHSTDQRFYDAIGRKGQLINCAIEKYTDGWSQTTSMRDGQLQTPQKDVGKAFDALFGGFKPPTNSTVTVDEAQADRRSILNLVLEDHKRLNKKLGYNDRLLVDQHLSSIRDLEKSIQDMRTEETLTCTIPDRLAENTSINNRNYGGEKERAILFNRIIALATACGISRVSQYAILRHKAWVDPTDYVSAKWAGIIKGNPKLDDLHEIGHNGQLESLQIWQEMSWWISSVYADLVKRFKDIPVGAGTLLDHSFIMMGMHQGIGLSLENSSRNHVHSYENMCYLQAGGKAFGAKTGRHIDGGRKHPVAVANKAMELMNVNITFGEIKDKVNIA